jgi:hypothetical protein
MRWKGESWASKASVYNAMQRDDRDINNRVESLEAISYS